MTNPTADRFPVGGGGSFDGAPSLNRSLASGLQQPQEDALAGGGLLLVVRGLRLRLHWQRELIEPMGMGPKRRGLEGEEGVAWTSPRDGAGLVMGMGWRRGMKRGSRLDSELGKRAQL